MPTTSFFKICRSHFSLTTPEGLTPTPSGQDSGDEEEMDTVPSSPVDAREYQEENEDDDDGEIHPTEAELGIRRSFRAQGAPIEELSLSDIVLDPDGTVAYYWLGIVCIAVIYNVAVIILRLAFKEMRDETIQNTVFYFCDTISDLIYMLDILVHFRTCYYQEGCLVLDPSLIGGHYKSQRQFYLDCLAILPLGTVSSLLLGNTSVLLARIPRLLKYSSMVKFFDLTDSRTRNPNWIRAFKLSLNLWIVIHWIGCVYFMLSEYEGLGTNEWVYPAGEKYDIFSRKYIRVMYWSLMTLTTIGERPSPETDLEYVFTGLTFLIGVFVFAAVVGNVGDVISNMNAARQEFQGRMDQIKFYLQHRDVAEKLQNKVKRWADYTWSRTQAIDEPTLLQMLPDRLRTEIAINVHLETLKKVKLFEECEEGLLRELVLKLRPQIYSPGDYICRIGEIGREMYIVNHGKVQILIPSGETLKRTVIATLQPGNYFGEISLLKLDEGQNRRTADVRAVGYSELLRLSRKDLLSALVEYPNAKKILEVQAKERMQKNKAAGKVATDSSPSPTDTARDDEDHRPRKKKDLLLNLVKSSNFKKLLAPHSADMTEIRLLLQELKTFDSQATKREFEALKRERDSLRRKLKKAVAELDKYRGLWRDGGPRNGGSRSPDLSFRRQCNHQNVGLHADSGQTIDINDSTNNGSEPSVDNCNGDEFQMDKPLSQCFMCNKEASQVQGNGHMESPCISSVQDNRIPQPNQDSVPNKRLERQPESHTDDTTIAQTVRRPNCNNNSNVNEDQIKDKNGDSQDTGQQPCPSICVTTQDGVERSDEDVVNDLLALDLDCVRYSFDSDRSRDSFSDSESSDHSDTLFESVE